MKWRCWSLTRVCPSSRRSRSSSASWTWPTSSSSPAPSTSASSSRRRTCPPGASSDSAYDWVSHGWILYSLNDMIKFLYIIKKYNFVICFWRQNSLPLTTNFSQNVTEPSKGISYPVCDLYVSQNWLGPMSIHYIVIRYPQQMVKMAFCDLSHTFHKQVTNVSQQVFVILLRGILTSPLSKK